MTDTNNERVASAPRAEGDEVDGILMRQLGHVAGGQPESCHEERRDGAAHRDEADERHDERGGGVVVVVDGAGSMQDHGVLGNQQWEYSAPMPPHGSIDDESRSLLEQIKKVTRAMRYGTVSGVEGISISGNSPLPFLRSMWQPPSRHHTSFTDHWREFSSALQNYGDHLECLPKKESFSFRIRAVQLTNDVVSMLRHGLRYTHFREIDFSANNFDRGGLGMVLDIVQNNPILEEFTLSGNQFHSLDDLNKLSRIVREHPAICTIRLDYYPNNGIDGHTVLCSLMEAGRSKLKSIDLSYSYISTGGSTLIADILASNPILESLELVGSDLVDGDKINIANALKHNTNLRLLHIDTHFGVSEGKEAVRETEFNSTSLNSAADSNHTCFAPGYLLFNGTKSADNANPVAARRLKIYCLLSGRNMRCENTRHFEDIPVEFLPDMLDAIHRYSDNDVWDDDAPDTDGIYRDPMNPLYRDPMNPLSIIYEVIRWWDKVFSVFEQKLLKRQLKQGLNNVVDDLGDGFKSVKRRRVGKGPEE